MIEGHAICVVSGAVIGAILAWMARSDTSKVVELQAQCDRQAAALHAVGTMCREGQAEIAKYLSSRRPASEG